MSETLAPTPIELLAREESTWHSLHIDYHSKLIRSVGKTLLGNEGVVCYERTVAGDKIDDLVNLREVEPSTISHDQALNLREQLDARWSSRNILYGLAKQLWEMGLLKTFGDAVGGTYAVGEDADSDLPMYMVWIDANGTMSVRVDNPNVEEDDGPIQWHEYYLLRGTSKCKRKVQPATGKPYVNTVINGHEIVKYTIHHLGVIIERLKRANQ